MRAILGDGKPPIDPSPEPPKPPEPPIDRAAFEEAYRRARVALQDQIARLNTWWPRTSKVRWATADARAVAKAVDEMAAQVAFPPASAPDPRPLTGARLDDIAEG